MSLRTCRVRTMTWSTPSAATATTSVVPAAGDERHRAWWCVGAARLISSMATRLRPDEGLRLPSGYVKVGRTCGRGWRAGASPAASSGGFAMTHWAISHSWSSDASS